jgi:hypothetical protein
MIETPASPAKTAVARANRWLAWILAASIACSALVIVAFCLRGDSTKRAWKRTVWSVTPSLVRSGYADDSWGPMARAFLRSQTREDGDIYGVFFDEGRKFQYPPTSLLVFFVVPDSWLGEKHFTMLEQETRFNGAPQTFFRTASQLAVLLTIAATIAIFETGIRRLRTAGDEHFASRFARMAMLTVLGLTFYPVVKAHDLGQVQVFLNALTAFGLLAHLQGWRALSGFCLGICSLVKPQLAVVLIWALFRRHWRVLGGFLAAVVPLGLVSLALFGWSNHLRYIEVIREIARLGEAFWANQSVNGVANRLLGNGDPDEFWVSKFAPYHPWVHAATLATSLLILGLAFFKRKAAAYHADLDLGVIIAAATMASPVAWEHHYGAFLPLFALALPVCLEPRRRGRFPGLALGACFLAMGVAVLAPDLFFSPRWPGLMASHLFFGAVLFFGLLLYLRRLPGGDQNDAARSTPTPSTGS